MYPLFKRVADFMAALVVLPLLLPLFIPVMIALKLTAEGEVFYLQRRVGYKNKYFDVWKFATMLKNSPNMGTGTITLRNDPRVTPLGRYLRLTKINELPQIINVLIGDMSVVGPRPLVDKTFKAYPPDVQAKVYNSPPGITGIGSIIFRNEEQLISENGGSDPHAYYASVIAPYKGALEMWYQQHKSFVVDLLLILLTAWVIVFKDSQLPYKVFRSLPPRPFK